MNVKRHKKTVLHYLFLFHGRSLHDLLQHQPFYKIIYSNQIGGEKLVFKMDSASTSMINLKFISLAGNSVPWFSTGDLDNNVSSEKSRSDYQSKVKR